MDDSSLKTLLLRSKQSGHVIPFTPGFNKKVFKYHCVVESEDEIRPEVSEADAFAQVLKSNSESGVTLKFGENTVDIKVDAADKSHSIYSIVVIRPNASDSNLRLIAIAKDCTILPDFHIAERNYNITLAPHTSSFTMAISTINPKSTISYSSQIYTGKAEIKIDSPEYGDTICNVTVTSSDKKSKSEFTFTLSIEKYGARLNIDADSLTCVFCTNVLFRPRKFRDCEHRYCHTCLELFSSPQHQQTHQVCCPVCSLVTNPNSKNTEQKETQMEIDIKSQSEIQSLLTPCPFSIYGCTKQDIPVKTIRTHILECKFIPKQCTECLDYVSSTTPHDSTKCTFTCPNCGRKVKSTDFERNFHSQLCNQEPAPSTSQSTQKWNPESWETNLSDFKKYASNNISSLVKIGMESLDTYQKSTAQAKYETSQTQGLKISLPNTTALRDAITAFATACIKQNQESQVTKNPLDSSLHLFLGLAIEECVLCENMFPEVVKVGNVVLDENKAASDSAMSDEVDGLLMSLGVPVSASKEKKLQAIEEEFQRLKGISSEQANEVQNLYQWKLNQIKHEDGGGDHLESQNKWKKLTLKHALKKYGDSIMISDDSTGANFRYGRMLMLSGNLEKAFVYLQTAVKRRPLHQGARIHLAACAILKQIKPTNSSTTKLYHQLLSKFLTDTQNSQWLNFISSKATANQNQSQQSLLLDDFDSPSATIFPIAHICLARAHFITGAPISTVSNVLKNGLYVFPDLMKQIGRKSTTFSQMKQNFVLLLREELCLEHISDCLNKINSENTTTVAGSGVKHDSKDKVDAIRMLAEKSWDVSSSANASAVGANEELQILWTSPLGALNHCNSQVGEDILKSIYFCSQPITPNNFSSITETLTSLGYFQLNVFDECKKNQLENESSKIRCDLESQIVDTEITFKSALGIINSASTLRKIVDLDWWMKIGELVKSYEDILTKKEEPIKPEGKKSIAPTKKIEVKKPAAPAGKEKSQPPVSKLGPPVKSTAGPSSKQPTSPKKPTLQTPATETKLKSASTSAKQSVENLTDSKQVAKKTEATQKSPTKPPNKATTNSTAAAAAVYLKTKPPSTTQTTKQAAPKTVVNSTSDAVPKPTRPPSAIKKDSPVPAKPEKSTVESADNTKPDLNATSESLFPPPPKTYKAVIGLARTLHRKLILLEEKTNIEKGKAKQTDSKCVDPDLCSEIIKWYTEAISFNPHIIDSYIELAGILESQDPTKISSILGMYPFPATADEWWTNEPSQDDLYFFGEVARYFMKEKKYDDKLLVSLIWLGRKGGVGVIQKYVDQLDSEGGQNMFLMRLYAGINRKDVTSSDMQTFFKAKYWI